MDVVTEHAPEGTSAASEHWHTCPRGLGEADGEAEGVPVVGLALVGAPVGEADGLADGEADGASGVGAAVGPPEGLLDGEEDGATVGAAVGLAVGEAVGATLVGTAVGATLVGTAVVGTPVGAAVGCTGRMGRSLVSPLRGPTAMKRPTPTTSMARMQMETRMSVSRFTLPAGGGCPPGGSLRGGMYAMRSRGS